MGGDGRRDRGEGEVEGGERGEEVRPSGGKGVEDGAESSFAVGITDREEAAGEGLVKVTE